MHLIPFGLGTLKRELQPAGRAIPVGVQPSGCLDTARGGIKCIALQKNSESPIKYVSQADGVADLVNLVPIRKLQTFRPYYCLTLVEKVDTPVCGRFADLQAGICHDAS